MPIVAKSLRIYGKVQGVFYRESMRIEAESLGLSGWVRNRLDGTVEAFVQGESLLVDKLVLWAHRGPDAARVDDVSNADTTPDPLVKGFIRKETV